MIKYLIFIFLIFFSCSSYNLTVITTKVNKNRYENEAILLGERLFFDPILSANGMKSCASCHNPQLAFTDGYRKSIGVEGDVLRRNASTLVNLSTYNFFTYGDTSLTTLEAQIHLPLFSNNPKEMGASGNEKQILERIKINPQYTSLFYKTFKVKKNDIRFDVIIKALAAFCRSIESYNTPFDTFENGDSTALSLSAQRGMNLFYSPKTKCGRCHGGNNLNATDEFFNIGLDLDDALSSDKGLFEKTQNKADLGAFRVPSLRNIAVTAPYMHDGRFETLEQVMRFYEQGGMPNEHKSDFIQPFTLTDDERLDMINFMYSLTDSAFLSRYAHH